MNAIEVVNVTKHYGPVKALTDVSFSVPSGMVYGFLGPNGAGKTTTVKIILQLVTSYQGQVTVFGRPVTPDSSLSLRRQIGYLPQEPVFPAKFSGQEVLQFVADNYSLEVDGAKRRIQALLSQFKLDRDKHRMVDGYSKGMKQRLGLAAAMLPEPQLLILDEPASALDPGGRREVLDIVNDQKGKTTVFFSSHILADVEQICDRVTVLQHGEKVIEDSVQDLLATYAPARYQLVVGASEKGLTQLLDQVDGLADVETSKTGASFGLPRERTDEIISQVLSLLLDSGVPVRELAPARTNLEEVFFQLLEQRNEDAE